MSIMKHVTLQKSVAHDFRYDPRVCVCVYIYIYVYIYDIKVIYTVHPIQFRTSSSANQLKLENHRMMSS